MKSRLSYRLSILLFSTLFFVTTVSCSGVATSQAGPSCGDQIDQDKVLVVDGRPFYGQPEMMSQFLSGLVGKYQLITDEPIGIPKSNRKYVGKDNYIYANRGADGLERIGQAIIESAMRGCNLLLVLESRVVTHPGKHSGNAVDAVWIVHIGESEG